jgi:DNA-binding transcriptional ArsR family regulator
MNIDRKEKVSLARRTRLRKGKGKDANDDGVGQRLKRAIEGKRPIQSLRPAPSEQRTLMMNPVRRDIYSQLCRRPCVSISDLARSLSTSRANASWHIDRMVDANLVQRRKVGKRWVHFPSDFLEEEDFPVLSILASPITRRVYKRIRDEPDISQGELCKVIRTSRQRLAWHLSNLVRTGLVELVQDGRFRRYRATPLFDDRAKRHGKRARTFKPLLMKALKKDGTSPQLVKSLARTLLIKLRSGKGTSVLEVIIDPYRAVLEED